MSPIDNPNDPNYGICRRLFIVLSQVFGDIPDLQRAYFNEWGGDIYGDYVIHLFAVSEAEATREMIQRLIISIENR